MPERTFDIWTGIQDHEAIAALCEATASAMAPYANTYGGPNENLNGVRLWADWDDECDLAPVNDMFDAIGKVLDLLGIAYDDEQSPTTDEDDPETAEALEALADDIENGIDTNCGYCGASIRVPWAMRDNPMCQECEADERKHRTASDKAECRDYDSEQEA